MKRHWFAVHRRLLDSDLWLGEPFTRGQAWLDLIGLARWKAGHARIRGIKVELQRGELCWSEVKLAVRWNWSRNKVRRFLKDLQTEQQIEQLKSPVTSVISVVNYGKYQPSRTTVDPTGETTERTTGETSNGTRKHKEKNEHKEKREKESATPTPTPIELLNLIDGWNGLGAKIVKPGNAADRDPPSQAVIAGWNKVRRNPEQRAGFKDLPALLAAIQKAKFCHGKDWFDLSWLFTAKNGQLRVSEILKGKYDDSENQRPHGKANRQHSSGVNFDPNAELSSQW